MISSIFSDIIAGVYAHMHVEAHLKTSNGLVRYQSLPTGSYNAESCSRWAKPHLRICNPTHLSLGECYLHTVNV